MVKVFRNLVTEKTEQWFDPELLRTGFLFILYAIDRYVFFRRTFQSFFGGRSVRIFKIVNTIVIGQRINYS